MLDLEFKHVVRPHGPPMKDTRKICARACAYKKGGLAARGLATSWLATSGLATCAFVCGLAACGHKSESAASPDDAAAVARRLSVALGACDHKTIDTLYDPKVIAQYAIGKNDERFIGLATKEHVGCDEPSDRLDVVVVDVPGHPLLRWRRGLPGSVATRTFGYLELSVAGTPAHVVDASTPLHPEWIAAGLHNIYSNLNEGDQLGMMTDIFGMPFTGIAIGAAFADKLAEPAHEIAGETEPQNLDNVIERAFISHDYAAAAVAIDELGKKVGDDVEIVGLQIAASLGAGHNDAALQQAHDATAKWPNELDAWLVRLPTEMAGGTKAGIDDTKAAIAALRSDSRASSKIAPSRTR